MKSSASPSPIINGPVELPARDRVAARISELTLYRYWVISILYILSLSIAVGCFAAVCFFLVGAKSYPLESSGLFGLFFTGGASGGIGAFLIRIDQEERRNIRLQQLVDALQSKPNPENLHALERVISHYLRLPVPPQPQH